LTFATTTNQPRWLSLHVPLAWPADRAIGEVLLPELASLKSRGLVRRYFFIRFSDGGYHVRIRVMPRPLRDQREISVELMRIASRMLSGEESRISSPEWVAYNRSEMYFGETPLSVYAELLNEQTTLLASELMQFPRHRSYSTVVASHVLLLWISSSSASESPSQIAADSIAFANNALAAAGHTTPELLTCPDTAAATIRECARRITNIRRTDIIERVGSLVRRVRHLKCGCSVAAHGIHLFCNKLGLSLLQERTLYRLASCALDERPEGVGKS
jgi:thiopeptide-type bacteriocin biosynthesis protein